jgi:hypothetical protein
MHFLTREARMHSFGELDQLVDSGPARQHRDVGDEAHLLHQLGALAARIQTQHT